MYQTDPGCEHEESLSIENTLWANTVLASGTALGVVVYTGRETRSVMNTSQPQSKTGGLMVAVCVFVLLTFFVFVFVRVFVSVLQKHNQ